MYILFIDFIKVYDNNHQANLIIHRKFKFIQKLIRLIEACIIETFVKVKVEEAKTNPIKVNSGLRRRDSMPSILFNLVLERVIRKTGIGLQKRVSLHESSVAFLVYADDLIFMDKSHEGLRTLFSCLNKAADKIGLQINEHKTEYLLREEVKV